jgi:hypothetical protein
MLCFGAPVHCHEELTRRVTQINLNYWVMHSVARVSIKYWNNLRTQHSIFLVLDFIVHFSHYRFRPRLVAIFRWFANAKNI